MPFLSLFVNKMADMKRLLFVAALFLGCDLSAQTISPIAVSVQSNVPIPWGLDNLSVSNGQLYCSSRGVMLSSSLADGTVYSLYPDTMLAQMGIEADYVVRNPRDSSLYFTYREENVTHLYLYHGGRFRPVRQVDIHGWNRDICHPAFSSNGNMMVFSSRGKVGLGGYDLWCSLWNGHRWTRPINLGNTINTSGNDINPAFYGNYLVFASDSGSLSAPGYHLYSVRMRQANTIDEIIFENYTVQPLPAPINGAGSDMNIAFDRPAERGYWVSNRSGRNELYSFSGQLDGVRLSGVVADNYGRPVPCAAVGVLLHGRLVNKAQTDILGRYSLFLLPEDDYRLNVSKDGYFKYDVEVPVLRANEDLLVAQQSCNVALAALPIERPMILQNVFSQNVDIDISAEGKESLSPIVGFLRDNPQVKATFAIYSDQTADESFNNLLISKRISALRRYLHSQLSSEDQICVQNGNEVEEISSENTGANFIFVTFGD